MLNKLTATVLFVQDLDKCMQFYQDIFGLESPFTDANSAAYRMDDHDFVLLKTTAAAQMLSAEAVALDKEAGHRVLLCLAVDDVDATYQALMAKGLTFITPPKSQDWGRRTTYFADPEGNLWELWQPLPAAQN
ncbi:MAG TPA: VOC family protein [Phototrophicaceae bacterium]|nr:VOC family protein [Phototrophicaceae bacterium]